ncbi:hypothetical protein AAFF_G00158910 [Aldrovandia affinis]|uniref:Uncharacterized protein n=1 Tax=Aldrovandia affinis TaxID=143900 RepID=A0AAD7W8E4_9TELE|nr:hypothetical protein AAFF_G00158910 [Aldrovandia affinis]
MTEDRLEKQQKPQQNNKRLAKRLTADSRLDEKAKGAGASVRQRCAWHGENSADESGRVFLKRSAVNAAQREAVGSGEQQQQQQQQSLSSENGV